MYIADYSGLESKNIAIGIRHAEHVAPSILSTNFADKGRSLGGYSSIVDSGHRVFFSLAFFLYY
jgi:hypothetical protein